MATKEELIQELSDAVISCKRDAVLAAVEKAKQVMEPAEIIDKGLPIERLNLGGIAKTKNSKFVLPNIAIKPEDIDILKEIENKGIEVFFQIVPDTKSVSLKDAIKSY